MFKKYFTDRYKYGNINTDNKLQILKEILKNG